MSNPNPILVIGATGNVGFATVTALAKRGLQVRAATRNPASEKAKNLAALDNVTVVKADLTAHELLAHAMAGVSALYIVTPAAENRAALISHGIDSAKLARVPHIVVVSVPAVDADTDVLFKTQFQEIEKNLKASGVPGTVLRLPMFMENQFANQGSIKSESRIYGPALGDRRFSLVSVADVGEASAAVLVDPLLHAGKTYTLASDLLTFNGIASAFTAAIGKEINYTTVPYPTAIDAMVGVGFPKWMAVGVAELMKLIDDGSRAAILPVDDLRNLLGRKPTSFEEWIKSVVATFRS